MPARVTICRSNPIAPDPRVEKIARALTSFGYAVRLLGWDRTGQLPQIDLLAASDVQDNLTSIPIYRLSIRAQFGHGLANLPGLLRWQWGLLRWLARCRHEYDLVHACDFDTIIPALLSKWLWKKKVVYDIFDFYADHLRATPRFIKRLIRAFDIQAIGWADGLILVDDSRWEQIAGARPKNSTVIYNSPERAAEAEQVPLSEGGSRPALCLAYVGLLQIERGLMEMLEVIRCHPEWRLDLAGFGGDETLIKSASQNLPNVCWHGRIPYDAALQLSQAADVLFATYDPAIPNHRYSSPNKVFEAMMLAKPIIVARGTNMDRMIEAADCGLVVDYGDVPALEKALLRLQTDPALRQRLGRNAAQAYQTTYSWQEMKKRLAKLYESVLSPKIILVANTDWYLYNFRRSLIEFLRAQGADVILVSPPGSYVAQLKALGYTWIEWKLDRKTIAPWRELPALLGLAKIYRSTRADLVHHHTIKPVLYGSLAARLTGIKAVVNSITGRGYVFLSQDARASLVKAAARPFYRLAFSEVPFRSHPRRATIFENEADRSFFTQKGLVPPERTFLIPGVGVDVHWFSPAPEPDGAPVVLLPSRMLWDKGVGVLVEAARLMRQKAEKTGFPFRIVLVGAPDPGNPASIPEEQLIKWANEGLIEWLGWQPDMRPIYAACHIVTLPTFGEGLPTVLLEAAACGRPIVATDVPGCREIAIDQLNALLVPPNDPTALAAALEKLIADPVLRGRMGAASRQLVSAQFTVDQVNHATLAVYQELLT